MARVLLSNSPGGSIKRNWTVTTFIIVLIVGFSNCGYTPLKRLSLEEILTGASVAPFVSSLPSPRQNYSELRVMILVDQSHSMIRGKCRGDLDDTSPSLDPTTCQEIGQGIDPTGDRFAIIQHWIDSLHTSSIPVKISLIPFSGGKYQRPRATNPVPDPLLGVTISEDPSLYSFLTPTQALARLGDLRSEAAADLARATADESPLYLGTTVHATGLRYARNALITEMSSLQRADRLYSTQFRFVYMTDGVYKPTQKIFEAAMNLASCPLHCIQDIPNGRLSACDAGTNRTFCSKITSNLYTGFGDPSENTIDNVVGYLKEIAFLPEYFSEGELEIDIVKLHPERIAADDKGPTKGLFDYIQEQIPDLNYWAVYNSIAPFEISAVAPPNLTYRLKSFYIVNLNAALDDQGKLVADSDGDGVVDALDTNPTNPRSDGYCFDSISNSVGCKKTSCIPTSDTDGDGLNRCEELTLESKISRKDTDGDAILDALEVIKGLSVNQDDNLLDSNFDGNSNAEAFYFGVNPLANLGKLLADPKESKSYIQFKVWENTISNYKIQVENIPLISTLDTTASPQTLYYSKNPIPAALIPAAEIVGPTTHAANVNEVLFLGKVVAIQNSRYHYWIIHREFIPVPIGGRTSSIEIDFSRFKVLKGVGR